MRHGYKNSFQKNPASFETQEIGMLSIEGDEGGELGGGAGGNPPADDKPFSVSKEDWDAAQAEIQQGRAERERLGGVEREFNQYKPILEKFKPMFEGGQGGNDTTPRAPDRGDRNKYPNTPEGAAKYLEDFTDYRYALNAQKTGATAQAAQREQQEAAQETQRTNGLVTEHFKRQVEARKSIQDFDKITNGGLITLEQHKPLALAILKLKNSAMVEYHLAKNPQEAMQLIRTAAVDLDDAKEVLFGLNHRYSEDAKKSAARRAAERGGYTPTHSIEGELSASSDDAADADFVKGRFGLK